ncbi:hypothetical protein LB577_14735 [Mesorhizobium sp. B283B1A]|uniref:hypothetical protein n=1 Tax=Mesorhizobium TaxID=68287 RepID=UPI001CD0F954|nr:MULTISPECIES: hypothetical protein [Mesorhizobium]MCA0048200.1 hypothetical protein [Mesorhizobium sp. B283B1A]UQS68227.1 hypothetical protein M5D98_14435 [Mesorhizobium opportunistum]
MNKGGDFLSLHNGIPPVLMPTYATDSGCAILKFTQLQPTTSSQTAGLALAVRASEDNRGNKRQAWKVVVRLICQNKYVEPTPDIPDAIPFADNHAKTEFALARTLPPSMNLVHLGINPGIDV